MQNSLIDRIPPQSLEAEQSALGAMMIDRNALIKGLDMLEASDFYRDAHATIFESLKRISASKEPVDIVTVQEDLRSHNRLESVGGTEYLMALIDCVPTAANIEYYATIVAEKSILRKMIDASTQIISKCHGEVENVERVIETAQKSIFDISMRRVSRDYSKAKDILPSVMEQIEERFHDPRDITGLPSGLHTMDLETMGWQNSDFIVIAARPSNGKTAEMLQSAKAILDLGHPIGIISVKCRRKS
jgi:replicative DNA helicase